MDKVKIKRVRRNKKKPTTQEKVLAGLGLGSTLLGGAGAISTKAPDTQIVRNDSENQGSGTSKIRQVLGDIFGAHEAKASGLSVADAQAAVDQAGAAVTQAQADYDGYMNWYNGAMADVNDPSHTETYNFYQQNPDAAAQRIADIQADFELHDGAGGDHTLALQAAQNALTAAQAALAQAQAVSTSTPTMPSAPGGSRTDTLKNPSAPAPISATYTNPTTGKVWTLPVGTEGQSWGLDNNTVVVWHNGAWGPPQAGDAFTDGANLNYTWNGSAWVQKGQSSSSVTVNLSSGNLYYSQTGSTALISSWLQAHPEAGQGTVTINKDSKGNIVSYTINNQTFTPQQLADSITAIGQQLYLSYANSGGGQAAMNWALNSLTPAQRSIYFLGSMGLIQPGTPYVNMPQSATGTNNTGAIMFTPPTTATMVNELTGQTSHGLNTEGWLTPAQAQAVLAEVKKTHPDAQLVDMYANFAGFDTNYVGETRRPYSISYTDSSGKAQQLDANQVLAQITTTTSSANGSSGSTVNPAKTTTASPTLTFTKNNGNSDTSSVTVGDSWIITITNGPKNSPVYAIGGKISGQTSPTDKTLMGQTDENGYFQTKGVFSSSDEGSWTETWIVGETNVGQLNFNLQAMPSSAGLSKVDINLLGKDQSWGMSGVNNDIYTWLQSHPEAAKGTITVNKDSAGNIISYTIAERTYTPDQLAGQISRIGSQIYGQTINDGLNSLSAADKAIYLLGTPALALPGTPYVYLAPVGSAQQTGVVTFTAPSSAQMINNFTGQSVNGLNAVGWVTPAQAQAALAQVQKTHPDAHLVDMFADFGGFSTNYGNDGRRPMSISYSSNGSTVSVDPTAVLAALNGVNLSPGTEAAPIPGPLETIASPLNKVGSTTQNQFQNNSTSAATVLNVSKNSVNVTVGGLDVVIASTVSNGVASTANITAVSDSANAEVMVTQGTGIITIVGNQEGTAHVTITSGTLSKSVSVVITALQNSPVNNAAVNPDASKIQTKSTTLTLSQSSLNLAVGGTAKINTAVLVNGSPSTYFNLSSQSNNILFSQNPLTGEITIFGLAPGTALINVHPGNLAANDTSADKNIIVNVSGSTAGVVVTATTSNSVNSDAQLAKQLQNQIAALNSRIDSLNAELASGQGGADALVVKNQVASLSAQSAQLSSLSGQVQSGQIHIFGSVEKDKGLKMKVG